MNSSEMPTYRHSAQDRKNLGILFFLWKTPQDTVPQPDPRLSYLTDPFSLKRAWNFFATDVEMNLSPTSLAHSGI